MAMFSLRPRRPRQFNLKYRYYDEQKERLQESETRVKQQLGMDIPEEQQNAHKVRFGVFRDTLDDIHAQKVKSMKLGVIIALVIVCAYVIVNNAV